MPVSDTLRTLADPQMQAGYLGGVVLDARLLEAFPLALEDMHGRADQAILGAMLALRMRGEGVSTDAVLAELGRQGRLRETEVDRVLTVTGTIPTDPGACAKRIRELSRLRRMRAALQEGLAAIEAGDEAGARRHAARAADVGEDSDDKIIPFAELLARGVEGVMARAAGKEHGLRLGTPSIDRDYTPAPGHLVIVGGRPNVGKTSLTFAWHIDTAERGIPSGIISVDDDDADYGGRGLGAISAINPARLFTERLSPQDVAKLLKAADEKQKLPIHFVKIRSKSVEGVMACATRMVRVHGCKWLSIDYLTAIRGGVGRDPRERTNDVLSQLDAHANILGVPLVLLVQLKRPGGENAYAEPTLESFKETGEIEERAKAGVLLWRKSDQPGEPVCAKLAKVKNVAAGRRFFMERHPERGLLFEVDGYHGRSDDGDHADYS